MNNAGCTKSDVPELAWELNRCSELIGFLEDKINELRSVLNFPLSPSPVANEIGQGPPTPMRHKVDMRIGDLQAANRRLEALNDDLPNIIAVVREI